MLARLCRTLSHVLAVVLLVAGSISSAAIMAPDRDDAAEARFALMGFSVADLCGHEAGHDHHCPFCHLVPEAWPPLPVEVTFPLLPFMLWRDADDLHRKAQARDHARSPRAPPSIA